MPPEMYQRLPSSPLSDDEPKPAQAASRTNCICALFSVFALLLNIAFSLKYPPITSSPAPVTKPYTDIRYLRRPSTFIRFDEVPRPNPPIHRQFDNYPVTISQIDSVDQGKVFPVDAKRHMAHIGTISPEDRRVLVDSNVSTVIQFLAIDWGMETCELKLSLPAASSSSRPVSFALHRLEAQYLLDPSEISYESRPRRIAKLADIELAHDKPTVWHRKLACQMHEVLTFELECSEWSKNSDCYIEWWQNKENPDPAIWITQHSTK